MKGIAPLIIVVVVLIALTAVAARNRRRMVAAEQRRSEAIGVGTEVMTTAGLYGTVVRRNDDDTAQLSIAPGVEVRWAVAALREIDPDGDPDSDADDAPGRPLSAERRAVGGDAH